ncbi:hypothetical protein SAMD00023353_0101360 [Rosellinia necatrix]|uniref:Extracellular mutant protein 11 C-terminal domain-containing protein n=1 Tax=Rosellinia necatrix TaxID=77044 RepID=A0A1S7UHI1_ROSNE|nr:hypothetical protein SAMD00023353_0101360 [Rosellinia necatrix]
MQAWVINNPELGHSQPGVATSAPVAAYDSSAPGQTQSQPQQQPQPQPRPQAPAPQTRHVNITQAKPMTAQQTSRGRSRSPIVNANAQRTAAAAAARIPMPPRSTHVHTDTRDGPVNIQRSRTTASEPFQQAKGSAPFWDESTAGDSAFSDTASNIGANVPFTHRQPAVESRPVPSYQQHENLRHRSAPRQSSRVDHPPPFVIGSNGLINITGNGNPNGNGLTRSASTPDARSRRGGFEVISDSGHESYTEENPYDTSPEKTPSGKRLQHAKPLAVRSTRSNPYPGRVSYPSAIAAAMPQPSISQVYPNHGHDAPAEVPQSQPEPPTRQQAPEHQPHRPIIFADTEVTMVSRKDDLENMSVGREPTPMPVTKPTVKAKPQVNRQLFARLSKGKADLRESGVIPRSLPEKRPSATKKRSFELDYDDGALAAMDYTTLKSEDFDFDPAQAEARSVFDLPRGTLPEKLEHFFTEDEANQANFFTKMPVKDWEESGDWFLGRFGEIMARFKEVRQEKRNIVNVFENEIAEREEAVRTKIHGIGQTLTDLKTEGEDMMLGKELR